MAHRPKIDKFCSFKIHSWGHFTAGNNSPSD